MFYSGLIKGLFMKNYTKYLKLAVLSSYFIFSSQVFSAPLKMTAPPRESAEAGVKLYSPIARYLSSVLGKKVIYEHPENWLKYQHEMRNDVYDIVFGEAKRVVCIVLKSH